MKKVIKMLKLDLSGLSPRRYLALLVFLYLAVLLVGTWRIHESLEPLSFSIPDRAYQSLVQEYFAENCKTWLGESAELVNKIECSRRTGTSTEQEIDNLPCNEPRQSLKLEAARRVGEMRLELRNCSARDSLEEVYHLVIEFDSSTYDSLVATAQVFTSGGVRADLDDSRAVAKLLNWIPLNSKRNVSDVAFVKGSDEKYLSLLSVPPKVDWIRAAYYTAITTMTIGYGDVVPYSSESKLLAAALAFFGSVLLSLIASTGYAIVIKKNQ